MVAAGSVFFDAFGSSSAEGRQGSGAQPGAAGAVPLYRDRGMLSAVRSYGLSLATDLTF